MVVVVVKIEARVWEALACSRKFTSIPVDCEMATRMIAQNIITNDFVSVFERLANTGTLLERLAKTGTLLERLANTGTLFERLSTRLSKTQIFQG